MKTGVIHGRFQPIHLGHMEYLLEGKRRCDFLYIGITNPDPGLTSENVNDKKRSQNEANPFTYFDRLNTLKIAMLEAGINLSEFEIVPFPINFPALLKYYVPSSATYFVTIYDEWGVHKKKVLEELGLDVEVMWEREMNQRFTSGTEVRNLIQNRGRWEHLVPPSVAKYIKDNNLDLVLQKR